jgi:molybdopterin molybdotransferase
MKDFLSLIPPQEALEKFLAQLEANPVVEEIQTDQGLGRVTAGAIHATLDLPGFDRSAMDGYAVMASDTYGSSDTLPNYLKIKGEVAMGQVPAFKIEKGFVGLIHTGGMLPEGADAVIMLEHTQQLKNNEVEIHRAIAPGENIIRRGEDVKKGNEVIPSGVRVRPAEIGGMLALGITRFMAARQPHIAIISTGDEVVSPDSPLKPGQVYDVNSFSIGALVSQFGGIPIRYGIVPDQAEELFRKANQALKECDLVVIVAGSSASVRDLTADVINRLGTPGVLVHGVNLRPGKPTILGICDKKPVIGLPGNPVSAMVVANLFLRPVLERMLGLKPKPYTPSIQATITTNIPSQAGREDWIPVIIHSEQNQFTAEPIFFKSNLIFTLARADGIVRIPLDATGLPAGETVQVEILR